LVLKILIPVHTRCDFLYQRYEPVGVQRTGDLGLGENRVFGCVNVRICFDQKTVMVYVGVNINDLRFRREPLKTTEVDLNNSVIELFSAEIQHFRKVVSC
jgi:hypothetical protein